MATSASGVSPASAGSAGSRPARTGGCPLAPGPVPLYVLPTVSNFSLTNFRSSRPADYARWASGGAFIGAVGYTLVAAVSWATERDAQWAHTMLLTATALGCWTGFVVSRVHDAFVGGSIAAASLWLELHLSLLIAPTFPSAALLATPVLVIAVGLQFGSRTALWTAMLSVAITTPLYLFSPAIGPTGFRSVDGYWLVVHAVVTFAAWGLISLSLSALYRMVLSLKEREQQLASVIADAPDGILVVSGEHRIRAANPAAERILGTSDLASRGVSLDTVLGQAALRQLSETISADDSAAANGDSVPTGAQVAQPALSAPGDMEGPVQWDLERDGQEPIHVEVTQRVLAGGRRQLMLRDVSPRVQAAAIQRLAEQRLEHAQRLEAVGQLAGGIAHDFNNLLLAIGGNAELLRDEPDAELRATLLDELQSAQERGVSLTRQILAFARKDVTTYTVFDLSALVSGMQRLLQRVAGEHVHVRYLMHGDTRIRADHAQVEQVLVNLVANARDAMPTGGVVTVTVEAVDGSDRVQLIVEDSGVGMDDAISARAIEPFFTTKPRGRGTGLGLSSVHGIVTRCGGELSLHSVPGKGTTVTVTLPHIREPETVPRTGDARTLPTARGVRILVAEDDDSTRAVVGRMLRRAGYSATLVPDGEQALRMLEAEPDSFSLVISDIVMPVLSGPAMAVKLRALYPDLPILFMSGYPETGFDGIPDFSPDRDFLSKPFSGAELQRLVEQKCATPATTGE
jgi:signal transduction histidine kinase